MVLGAIIVSVLLAMAVYGFWLAGQLGVGPRWRRPPGTATTGRHVNPAPER